MQRPLSTSLSLRDALLTLAVMVVWGTNFVVIRIGVEHFPPLLFACLRFTFALLSPLALVGVSIAFERAEEDAAAASAPASTTGAAPPPATLRSIVASDEIGNFPDQNAAESIQRIPGVSLYRDQGEGRYIVLRGLNYTFTSVKVNGGSFAGADLGERATALDVIPADALASIEVTKVPTPDMDGEGLGGQVDIKTKSPFDAEGLAAHADSVRLRQR